VITHFAEVGRNYWNQDSLYEWIKGGRGRSRHWNRERPDEAPSPPSMKYEENLKFYKYAPIKEKKNDKKPNPIAET